MSSVCFIYKGACLSTTVVFMPSCHLYLLGVTLYSLSWTAEFLWHFRSASRTKWLCVHRKLIRVISAYTPWWKLSWKNPLTKKQKIKHFPVEFIGSVTSTSHKTTCPFVNFGHSQLQKGRLSRISSLANGCWLMDCQSQVISQLALTVSHMHASLITSSFKAPRWKQQKCSSWHFITGLLYQWLMSW